MPFRRAATFATRMALSSLLLSVARPALADGLYPDNWEALPSVQADVAQRAARQTATFYGTASSLERNVFPMLPDADVGFVFGIEQNWLINVTHVPMDTHSPIPEQRFQNAAMSTYAANVVMAYKFDQTFGMFYGTSLSTAFFPGSTEDNRMAVAGLAPLGLIFYQVPTAPLSIGRVNVLPTLADESFGISADWVLGGRANVAGTSMYLGYLGSSIGDGVYTNVTQDKLRLLLSTAIGGTTFEDLFYLKAGFDRARGLLEGKLFEDLDAPIDSVSDEVPDPIGKTSLFVRRLQFVPPQPTIPIDATDELRRVDFWTGHLEQLNIAQLFDVSIAAAADPFLLHEAIVSVHTPGYDELSGEAGFWNGARLSLGMVELPPMTYFAQQGGKKFMFAFESKAGSTATFSIRHNDPNILGIFPYAYDAWNIYVKMLFF
jgi:hypothetical protein